MFKLFTIEGKIEIPPSAQTATVFLEHLQIGLIDREEIPSLVEEDKLMKTGTGYKIVL